MCFSVVTFFLSACNSMRMWFKVLFMHVYNATLDHDEDGEEDLAKPFDVAEAQWITNRINERREKAKEAELRNANFGGWREDANEKPDEDRSIRTETVETVLKMLFTKRLEVKGRARDGVLFSLPIFFVIFCA